jgi:Phytanoyl-CoA dioxygenase (PhyH)
MAAHRTADLVLDDQTIERFRVDGYAVLRNAFDPRPLAAEIDRVLRDGFRPHAVVNRGSGGVGFQGVVMMGELTPVSLGLVDLLAAPAAQLLDRAVLPGRAKCVRYTGSSGWHRDSEIAIPSMSFVTYLEALDASSGALRVFPRSHRETASPAADELALETMPGDLIAFDEHLTHGSVGGAVRRQWRVDFIADPMDAFEEELLRATFERIFDVSWDGGDDVDRYPSYGGYWQSRDRSWTPRLRELGVYELAARHAAAVRAHAPETDAVQG